MSDELYPENKAIKTWTFNGLNCALVPHYGYVNGYVQVPEDHVAYGQGYDRIDVDVHGTLTYANSRGWFGFDTGHDSDYWSDRALAEMGIDPPSTRLDTYGAPIHWTWLKILSETNRLALQLSQMTELPPPTRFNITNEEFEQLLSDSKMLRQIRQMLD